MNDMIEVTRRGTRVSVSDGRNDYSFERLTAGDVKGTPIEEVQKPVTYVGEDKGSLHYVDSKPTGDVPEAVVDELVSEGFSLVAPVDGGWKNWEGRPEWSETYLDASEAEVVRPSEE